jgi:hypothetical protein
MKLLLISTLLFATNALASDLDFTLVNETDRSFEGVYVSASDDKDWDGNLLKDDKALPTGGRIAVKFERTEAAAKWDMNVVDADGVAVAFTEIDLTGADTVTLRMVEGKVTAEVE